MFCEEKENALLCTICTRTELPLRADLRLRRRDLQPLGAERAAQMRVQRSEKDKEKRVRSSESQKKTIDSEGTAPMRSLKAHAALSVDLHSLSSPRPRPLADISQPSKDPFGVWAEQRPQPGIHFFL